MDGYRGVPERHQRVWKQIAGSKSPIRQFQSHSCGTANMETNSSSRKDKERMPERQAFEEDDVLAQE